MKSIVSNQHQQQPPPLPTKTNNNNIKHADILTIYFEQRQCFVCTEIYIYWSNFLLCSQKQIWMKKRFCRQDNFYSFFQLYYSVFSFQLSSIFSSFTFRTSKLTFLQALRLFPPWVFFHRFLCAFANSSQAVRSFKPIDQW